MFYCFSILTPVIFLAFLIVALFIIYNLLRLLYALFTRNTEIKDKVLESASATIRFVIVIIVIYLVFVGVYWFFFEKYTLSKKMVYGEYVIDRSKFSGYQADWQYEHYKIEISKDDTLHLIVDFDGNITEYKKKIYFVNGYANARWTFVNSPDAGTHHIIQSTPYLFRTRHSYYYVFYSEKYGNVFFKKKPFYSCR